jgi:pimeloyl-ACP methyl ester carboxylesterase
MIEEKGEKMATLLGILGWAFGVIFLIAALLMLGMGGRVQFFLVLFIALIFLPPIRALVRKTVHAPIPWWAFGIVIILLAAGVMLSFTLNPAKSIYKSPKYAEALMKIYDARLAEWPVPYESVFVDTKYGQIHVIVSGPDDGYPVLLINASALSGWSWIHNVGALNKKYRTYAIDNIGEGGKNRMIAPGKIPKTGEEIACFYTEITNELGVGKAHVIGASIGGYISTNYAVYAPDRVDKLVLLGSMGYGSTGKTVIAMTLAQGFPIKPVQDATFRWAFGDDSEVIRSFGEWFRITMKGMVPTPIPPKSLNPEELRKIEAPTLAFFGTKDGVIGDAEKAKQLAENIPDVRVMIVESGHVIGAELADRVNAEILDFFGENED